MTRNGNGFVSARKSRFSLTRTFALTHSAYAPISASAGFKSRLRYAVNKPVGTRLSSSMTQPINCQNRWSSFSMSGLIFRPASSATIRGTRRSIFPAFWATCRISASHSGFRSMPNAYIYSLLSRTRSKSVLKKRVSRFLDLRHYLRVRQPIQRRFMFALEGKRPLDNSHRRLGVGGYSVPISRSIANRHVSHVHTVLNPVRQVKQHSERIGVSPFYTSPRRLAPGRTTDCFEISGGR